MRPCAGESCKHKVTKKETPQGHRFFRDCTGVQPGVFPRVSADLLGAGWIAILDVGALYLPCTLLLRPPCGPVGTVAVCHCSCDVCYR
jgi:hypothetical protein